MYTAHAHTSLPTLVSNIHMDSLVQGLQGLMALGPILKLMQSSNPSPLDKFDTRVKVGVYTAKVLD